MDTTTIDQLREGFVGAQLARINRNLFVTPIVFLALTVGALVVSAPAIRNRLDGPFAMDRATLLKLDSPNTGRYYVTVQGDDNADTGIYHTESRGSDPEVVDAVYHALSVGDRLLLVKLRSYNPNLKSLVITGSLSEFSATEQKEVIEKLESDTPGLKGHFLPFKLDATDTFDSDSTIAIVITSALALVTLFAAFQWLRRVLRPNSHPLVTTLRKLGDPAIVAAQVNQDVPNDQKGNVVLGNRWVGFKTTYGLKLNALRNAVWVYPKKVTTRYYGVIPVGSRFSVMVHTRDGRALDLPTGANRKGERASNDLLTQVSQRAPWCITGYSADLKRMWGKQRADMLSLVDQRLPKA